MVEKVYLVRHGHIDNGGEKRYLGRTDVPLDFLGLEQAQRLREYFQTIPIDAVFTSPLKRSLQTAHMICLAKNMHYESVEALCEIDMGDWENVEISYIKSRYPELYAQRGANLEYFKTPHGESFHDVGKRTRTALSEIIDKATGTIIVVAHAGVNRMILSHLLGIAIKDMFSIDQPYAGVSELIHQQNGQWHYAKQFTL